MLDILDEMCELIYVVDVKTYEVLYLNSKGKVTFGVDREARGQKCFAVLQGRQSPCPYCPNAHLRPGEVYEWEQTNPVSNRHYLLKDKLIDWQGIAAKIEIAFDTTEKENEKNDLKVKLETENVIMRCIRRLYLTHDLSAEIPNILKEIGTYFRAERTYMFRIQNHKMYNTYEWCAEGVTPQIDHLQGLDEALIDCWKPSFSKQESYIMPNIEEIRDTDPDTYQVLCKQKIHSLVAVPLDLEGKLIGYLGVDNPAEEKMKEITLMFHALQFFLMASIRRAADEAYLWRLSYYDPLTGAYNRNRYLKTMQELSLQKEPVGIVYLDINGLKDINDQKGHPYGDQVILTMTRLINHVFGPDQLYRVGGDEFVVLCVGCSQEHFQECILQLKKLIEAKEDCSAAIGYYWAADTKNIEQKVSRADVMMYEDKKRFYRGGLPSKRYRHYNDAILELRNPEMLRHELRSGRFLVYLQPKISFKDRVLAGAEALVRYQAPNGEIISPLDILPLLEELHLISLVDFYVFEFICMKISEWEQKGRRCFPISVNFSRDTISEIDFIPRLCEVCNQYHVNRKYLEIEITESVESMKDFDLQSFSTKMREAGFRISIDDFGVHYANLSLLTSIEFDKLKIDKSLVDTLQTNPKTQLVCNALSAMCLSLQIETTVEGVETEKQFALLQSMGFQEAQGFLFNRPIPIEIFEKQYF